MAGSTLERFLPDEEATTRLGEDLALALRAGDVLALHGDLGAGKTTLARGLLRALAGDPEMESPSPTFTLVQVYETRIPVHHFDLYRLSSPSELDELGFDEAVAQGAALVEWPEKAGNRLPENTVHIMLDHRQDGRLARISSSGPAFERIGRSLAIRDFLSEAGFPRASRSWFTGDASARSYEIIDAPGHPPRILMNSPALVLGPPVRDGKPYAEIAHTALTVSAFVALDRALKASGFCAPEIFAQDFDQGFLLLEHLGSDGFLEAGKPVPERYAAAAELLAAIHAKDWPRRIEAAPGIVHEIPLFDREAMMIEAELLLDWYVPMATGKPANESLRADFTKIWNTLFDRLAHAEQSLVLRDFHSPNIVWRGEREGQDRLGLVDFQDALIGPSAYDVASLAMDARVTVSPEIENRTVQAYVAARKAAGPFDEAAFGEAYAIMAAQRNSKILGIFVRLDRRDGKPDYLMHLPRIRDYLQRAFDHQALSGLADLYRRNGLLGDRAK